MNPARRHLPRRLRRGLHAVTREGEPDVDTGVDFGIGRGRAGGLRGAARQGDGLAADGRRGGARGRTAGREVARHSLFDEPPTALHVPGGTPVRIRRQRVVASGRWRAPPTSVRSPPALRARGLEPEYRGLGLVQNACLRNVRLIFDHEHRPESNLVLGEVVNFPGRWSSYPPHHHVQPEIYHYRFTLPQGYGHAELGEDVFKVRGRDTVKILDGVSHAQVSAPGYGMYYLWIVRHLPGNPYTGFRFDPEHAWVLDAAQQGWQAGGRP